MILFDQDSGKMPELNNSLNMSVRWLNSISPASIKYSFRTLHVSSSGDFECFKDFITVFTSSVEIMQSKSSYKPSPFSVCAQKASASASCTSFISVAIVRKCWKKSSNEIWSLAFRRFFENKRQKSCVYFYVLSFQFVYICYVYT